MSKATNVIQIGINYIKNDNSEGLEKVLNILPLDKLGKQGDTLLFTYLSVCAKYNRPELVKIILDIWEIVYPKEESIQILSRLFLLQGIDIHTLAFVILSHEDYTYVELMDDLMSADNSPEVITACGKADRIFGNQPYETYKIIREHSLEMKNYKVEEYAIDHIREVAPFAPVPKWVKNYTNKPIIKESEMEIPETGNVQFDLPTDDEAVEILTKGLSQNGIATSDIKQAKDYLRTFLSTSTRKEKIDLLKPVMENLANEVLSGEISLFRLFGPANPLVNQDLTLNTPSSKYGGCRMFLCDIFDYDFDLDYVVDWFQGSCEQCDLRIKHRWYAVRRPRPHGGWLGSFCSWKCARESIFSEDLEPALLTRELIKIFGEQTDETGIQDRLEDTEDNKETEEK